MTFQLPGGAPGTLVTHRIISIKEGEERIFQTKGDANGAEDYFKVPASNVIGKLAFVIPFAGYLPDYFKRHISSFLLLVMLPACLLIIGEIKDLILYSNPSRARRVEREKKKAARKTFYKIKGMRLTALILISGLVFAGIVASNLGQNGPAVLERENKIGNSGFLPIVYAITPDTSEQKLTIHRWYGVISPANESQVTAPDNTPVQISSAPYILPVFWIIALAEINPYLPAFAEIVLYTSVVTLILLPIWYKKSTRGKHKKRISFRRRFAQWKRTLHV
jgi:signal peptidase